MIFGGAFLILTGLLTGERPPAHVEMQSIAAFLYLIFAGSIVAYVSYLYALRHLPVAFVSTYMYVNPVLALWLGHLILGERLTIGVAVATVLILMGLLVMRSRSMKSASLSGRQRSARRFWRVPARTTAHQHQKAPLQPAPACLHEPS
jgi:drug/metabolite transporter (DMT)-like permease